MSKGSGPLIIVGGRFERNNTAIFEELKRLSNGTMGILATASEIAEEVGTHVAKSFKEFGIDTKFIPLFWEGREKSAYDPDIISMIEDAGSIYFTGGDQRRIMQTFFQNDTETPILTTLRELHSSGGLVAGSSAGAAIMSNPIILRGNSLHALSRGNKSDSKKPGVKLGTGFGFFEWGITDQHFIHRGRIGRLTVALLASGRQYGFGIDENSAMVVENGIATVIGETGVILIHAEDHGLDTHPDSIENIWMSYVDDGDKIDLTNCKILPHADKKLLTVSDASFRKPAATLGNAFGSYTLHDLLFRLAQGDPSVYNIQSATAYDRAAHVRVTVEMERVAERSQVLISTQQETPRFTAIDIGLRFKTEPLASASHASLFAAESSTMPNGKLLLLGSSPVSWPESLNTDWINNLPEPIGIIAAASSNPPSVTEQYLNWLSGAGKEAQALDLRYRNADRRNYDSDFLQLLGRMKTIIFTGGDQRRLAATLRRRGEATRVFRFIQQAYLDGLTLVGVGGAAGAFGSRMIAEGSSRQALRFGSSEDAGFHGILIDEGLGFFRPGLVDQNFIRRHRLGRLIVGCAEEGFHWGLGLSETSGIELNSSQSELTVFGGEGVYVTSVDQEKLQLDEQIFAAREVSIQQVLPGQSYSLEAAQLNDTSTHQTQENPVQHLVTSLIQACEGTTSNDPDCDDSWLRLSLTKGSPALLDINSHRDSS